MKKASRHSRDGKKPGRQKAGAADAAPVIGIGITLWPSVLYGIPDRTGKATGRTAAADSAGAGGNRKVANRADARDQQKNVRICL